MSKVIATVAIEGARACVSRADEAVALAVEKHGRDAKVSLTDTAYYLPVIYALTGKKVQEVGDLEEVMIRARGLLSPVPSETLCLPYFGTALDAGVATLFAQEAIEALKVLNGLPLSSGIWLGPTPDAILREQGIKLVDGRMPGFAVCVGAMPTTEAAVKLARDLQERNILVFMAGHTGGVSMAEQLAEAAVEMNWDTFLVPYGKDISAAIHAFGFSARAAMTFGGVIPSGTAEARKILHYTLQRVHAFVLALGEVDAEKGATAAGALVFGFPVIADTALPEILPSGVCAYEHIVSSVGHDEMPTRAMEVRGLKLRIDKVPIPVRYGPAFEGERVRKEMVAAEFGGKFAPAFEHLEMADLPQVEDDRIEVIG
ncbi:MAG: CO dehydrogenase/CO-methylating acetyl-CoA synthase complex subunit beta, partial [Candidatus Eisenbacteria sp.]|nr:CO dehydrogenase/CO-methylating acetyl-CoA synthase complex subunit beta [Candidatus Eisenbacteria bacterium]